MRPFTLATILATATALAAVHANAAPLIPALELTDGLAASIPVTTGSISAPGGSFDSFTSSVTATSVPAPEPVSLAILGSGLL